MDYEQLWTNSDYKLIFQLISIFNWFTVAITVTVTVTIGPQQLDETWAKPYLS